MSDNLFELIEILTRVENSVQKALSNMRNAAFVAKAAGLSDEEQEDDVPQAPKKKVPAKKRVRETAPDDEPFECQGNPFTKEPCKTPQAPRDADTRIKGGRAQPTCKECKKKIRATQKQLKKEKEEEKKGEEPVVEEEEEVQPTKRKLDFGGDDGDDEEAEPMAD